MSWTCPECGRVFRNTRQWHSCVKTSVDDHFANRTDKLRQAFDQIVLFCRELGNVEISPVKTAIQFREEVTFLSVVVKSDHLRFEFQLPYQLEDFIVSRTVKVSENRYFHEVVIDCREDIHEGLLAWIEDAYLMVVQGKNKI